jgi:hypothetical protein
MVKREKNDPMANHPESDDSFPFVLEKLVKLIDEKTIIYQSLFLSNFTFQTLLHFGNPLFSVPNKVLMHFTFHHL